MFALSPGGGGRSPTTTRERLSPSLISRKTLPTVVFPPSSAKGYANKPLPPPPPPTPPMQPDTPMIIQAFPTIPGRPAVPSPERPSLMFPTPTRQRARSSFGSAPSSPLLTPTGVSRHDRSPSPSPTIAVDGSLAPPSPRYAGQSQLPYLKPRPQTTYDGESPTIAAPTHQGRSVSVSSLQEPVVKRRPKKPKLVPGVWIGDDDVRDEDDEETGWANIVVTKHVLG
ncbi:hypothetical protein FRB95_011761 [Tulasnella sp. JGI-2019a]|nr:hypothetical protein FRB93_000227 [Tulasnella sp. JGI-2019a]KAG9039176.1 hypothetical protein FRB95_011761 [Tulasnella sp. JGI-2019a]